MQTPLHTIYEIKEFMKWCKKNQVKSFSSGDLSFELSDLAFLEDLNQPSDSDIVKDFDETAIQEDLDTDSEDEELLYHSTNQ